MDKIEVKVIAEHGDPAAMMSFLARLTQRGANITSMRDLEALMDKPTNPQLVKSMVALENHHTIRRFTPITVAIVGASRRFLAQIRTHSVGLNFVSASLQYSDYSGKGQFVVPYELFDKQHAKEVYLKSCENSMSDYEYLVNTCGCHNDTAGYAAPQGLRNILIIQGNHDAWLNLIKLRSCHRNTNETQYVVLRIWEELMKTQDGEEMFAYAGPDCLFGNCKEGKMCCGDPMRSILKRPAPTVSTPRYLINKYWPLLNGGN